MTRQRRRICIFGGTGFVGRHLVNRLTADGYEIIVPTRDLQAHRQMLVVPGLELRPLGDDVASMRSALRGCDVAINLVGILNERGHAGRGFHSAHVEFTANVIAACRRSGVHRIIQMSALKANAARGPSHYLRSKGAAEQLLAESGDADLRYTILQPSVIFGPDDSFINRFARLLRLFPLMPLAKPRAMFAPVFIDDLIDAIAKLLTDESTSGRTYELCGPDAVSLNEILMLIKRHLHIRSVIFPLPNWLALSQALVCDYCVPGKPFSLDNFRSMSVDSVCTSNGFARLGIGPRGFRAMLPALLNKTARPVQLSELRAGSRGKAH